MTLYEIMEQLQQLGTESIKKVLVKHGAREPFFGVKIEDLKKIQKKVKADYSLSLSLYATGNSDAMYLAGLIAEPAKMTHADLNQWAEKAYWYMLSEFTVAGVAAESPFGSELALQWIDSDKENIASAGWATLANIAAIKQNEELDSALYIRLLDRISASIHTEKNRVRSTMNIFVITVGGYCSQLLDKALSVASSIGKVNVNMGGTACKVPLAIDYIKKMHDRGSLAKKKKSARC
ncbi:MAG: DNA alkylation repair protein [Bacteroidota bacterium]